MDFSLDTGFEFHHSSSFFLFFLAFTMKSISKLEGICLIQFSDLFIAVSLDAVDSWQHTPLEGDIVGTVIGIENEENDEGSRIYLHEAECDNKI